MHYSSIRFGGLRSFLALLLIGIGFSIQSCSALIGSNSNVAYIDADFWAFTRVGIISDLPPAQENLFIPLYAKTFPGQEIYDRRYLAKILGEQDLLPSRIDASTRAQLGKLAGLEAIIVPYWDSEQFAVRIDSVETGQILGTVNVDGAASYRFGKPSANYFIHEAIAQLKAASSP